MRNKMGRAASLAVLQGIAGLEAGSTEAEILLEYFGSVAAITATAG
jgi:hypothetical protein